MSKLKVVDLFSGAGGLSRGFLDAGYDVVLGVDFDDAALRTFKANHGSAEALKLDLFNHDNISVIVDYLKNKNISLGTTPRRITDLVGSLSDLVSGSGDKGTPIVLITGYFDNYATE